MDSHLASRRRFLKGSALGLAGVALFPRETAALASAPSVSLVVAPNDPVSASAPAQWALGQLQKALEATGATVRFPSTPQEAPATDRIVIAAGRETSLARNVGGSLPAAAEAAMVVPGSLAGRQVLLVSGNEPRGLAYALLELSDRVVCAGSTEGPLATATATLDTPRVPTRSVCRSFQSEIEDKPWFNDKAFWTGYLTQLAANRFNRFNLSFGLGENWNGDGLRVADAYFLFPFPFFVAINGVYVSDLPASERGQNLAMLRFVSDECARRGLEFQLGIWTSGFSYSGPKYAVNGLSGANGNETHAAYCRDALAAILNACPNVTGVTFRVHFESGIPARAFGFWRTVFSAVTPFVAAGRHLEIDMHAKNCFQGHIDAATASGGKVVVSPKKWAEHQGLPYHQASLRPAERSAESDPTVLDGQASRYGYANFLHEGRNYGVLHRLWPGSQRHLLWADPVFAAGYGRSAVFCGSQGLELYEALSFKGRQGTGTPGGRCAYADRSLSPGYDYEKFLLYYRVWGRCLYDPEGDPAAWRRYYAYRYGAAARDVEEAVASASRILMLVSTYHGASADNHVYWPEVYVNFAIADGQPGYHDSQNPLRAATSFDPQLFLDVDPSAEALLAGGAAAGNTYGTVEFAQWLEDLAEAAESRLAAAQGAVPDKTDPDFRRIAIDVGIETGLGRFFAAKFRCALLWSIYRKSNDPAAKDAALTAYGRARDAWGGIVSLGSAYANLAYGSTSGHWKDRLPALDADIAALRATQYTAVTSITTHPGSAAQAIAKAQGRIVRPTIKAGHAPPSRFTAARPLPISVQADASVSAATLHFRQVNQAEAWQSLSMSRSGADFQATIPGEYMRGDYPLQYYFAFDQGQQGSAPFPGFDATLANIPYYVVRSSESAAGILRSAGADRAEPTLGEISVIPGGGQIEILYALSRGSMVSAALFDMSGRIVCESDEVFQPAGSRRMSLRTPGRARGECILRIRAGGSAIAKTIFLSGSAGRL